MGALKQTGLPEPLGIKLKWLYIIKKFWNDNTFTHKDNDIMDAITTAASLLTSVWGTRGFPVDPVWLAGQYGIRVMETDLPKEVSGALIKKPNEDPTIVLSRSDSKTRRRFTCAHELGHYVSRVSRGEEQYAYVDLRAQSAATGNDSEEIFANNFAAALLMPEDSVRSAYEEMGEILLIAPMFGVSPEALSYRLKNLGLIAF